MSSRSSSRGGPHRKPRFDLYSWMLLLSLVALVIACVCLFLEVKEYGDKPYELSRAAPVAHDHPATVAWADDAHGPAALDGVPPPADSIHG